MNLLDFEALRDFILLKNPYFDKGFANAFKENKTNWIWTRDISGDLISVAPQDTYGNYFYLRNDEGIVHTPKPGISTYGAGHTTYLDVMRVNMIGVLKDGDPFAVVDNIINTFGMYQPSKDITMQLISSNWNREQILINELSGVKDNDIMAALQRLGEHLIFKIIVSFSKYRMPTSCINPICTPCNQ